ncbi:5'/3'-nucleotidase SurE [Clostridium cochlearium]|jgi:5'-nucleotidase|uniref:5'/3'-nucleotidase SurE n=1 Tax=Clostridium cochlearium TaxID=1494 RepID=UPI00241EDFB3|nr:5'/3'-nucleotidase SurE [Clostridium cochlearium]MBE6065598.1 5'/3'-nucleotidase SurE [Clostridium cochlearium]
MRLLLTNDDGVNSEGIYTLAKELQKEHEIIIAAPSIEMSAKSHSITISDPLFIKEVELEGIHSSAYSISGTPADCVKVAMDKILTKPVDMVISGINYGTNLGIDILYSGTVSAAIEAAIHNVPSIAISSEVKKGDINFNTAANVAKNIIKISKENFTKNNLVLNVNVPCLDKESLKGIKVCQMGGRTFTSCFEEIEKENEISYILRGELTNGHKSNTDIYYLRNGYATITPLHYDLTNFKIINDVCNWFKY